MKRTLTTNNLKKKKHEKDSNRNFFNDGTYTFSM